MVYTRIAADALYPRGSERNYANVIEGLTKISAEGVLFRGALGAGLAYGGLLASMSSVYDFLKEYMFYFFGAASWLRPVTLIPVTALGAAFYLPFDNIKTRLHLMTALPDGRLPYSGSIDAFLKAFQYEANFKKYSTGLSFYNGGISYCFKLYISLFAGVKLSDLAFRRIDEEGDFIEQGRYFRGPFVKLIPHKPLTREEINRQILEMEPQEKFYTDWSEKSSFKI